MYPVPDILPLNQGGCHDKDGDSKHNNCPELLTGMKLPFLSFFFACRQRLFLLCCGWKFSWLP